MLRIILVFIIALLLINIWFYAVYLSVNSTKNKVCSAYSKLDAQLKQRYDLIPHILMAVGKIMNNEAPLIEDAIRLRNEVVTLGTKYENIDRRVALDSELGKKMIQIITSAEKYPELVSEQGFLSSVSAYKASDESIYEAVEEYNTVAKDLKIATEVFPFSFISRLKQIKNVNSI